MAKIKVSMFETNKWSDPSVGDVEVRQFYLYNEELIYEERFDTYLIEFMNVSSW